jgi:hypothetical protein
MSRYSWLIAVALLLLPGAAGHAGEMEPAGESRPADARAASLITSGFDGFLTSRLTQLAATLNVEREKLGLSFDGTPMGTLLGYVSANGQHREAQIDRLGRELPGLRFATGQPEQRRQLQLRIPLSAGAAVTSGYQASPLDLGLSGTDGDVAHEFKIGASLRF